MLERRFGSRIPMTTGGFEIKTASTLDYNPGQNTWNKIDKSSKIGQDKKSFISNFPYFLAAIAKV